MITEYKGTNVKIGESGFVVTNTTRVADLLDSIKNLAKVNYEAGLAEGKKANQKEIKTIRAQSISTTMKSGDKPIFPEFHITQRDVGAFGVDLMAYVSDYDGGIRFSHEISVHQADGTPGWGNKIFDGSLADLIETINHDEQYWADEFRRQGWTEPR